MTVALSSSPDWTALPKDMLGEISKHLPPADKLTIRGVCRDWRANTPEISEKEITYINILNILKRKIPELAANFDRFDSYLRDEKTFTWSLAVTLSPLGHDSIMILKGDALLVKKTKDLQDFWALRHELHYLFFSKIGDYFRVLNLGFIEEGIELAKSKKALTDKNISTWKENFLNWNTDTNKISNLLKAFETYRTLPMEKRISPLLTPPNVTITSLQPLPLIKTESPKVEVVATPSEIIVDLSGKEEVEITPASNASSPPRTRSLKSRMVQWVSSRLRKL